MISTSNKGEIPISWCLFFKTIYKTVGCTYAVEINQKIYEKEPLDLQLEFSLANKKV